MTALQNHRGFTLIEILTAVFILAIVMSLVMGSFGSIYGNSDHINIGTDLHEMGNTCMERITKDLQAIYVAPYPRYKPPDINDDPEIYHVKGESRNVGGGYHAVLRFTSMAHLPFGQDRTEGIAQIIYYPQETEEGDVILRRADKLYPYPEEFEESDADPVLCEQILKFELVYYDAEGESYEEWDSETDATEYGTPRSVEVKLVLGTKEHQYAFSSRINLPTYRYKKVKR